MIELDKHIEILLLSNDCVIVPALGGFVAHYVEARIDERDNSFLPPMRTIGFNPKLDINDSLLVHSYIEAYDMSYPDAISKLEGEVSELKAKIDNNGFYELNNIGVLSLNGQGQLEFCPSEAGILTPELYGLSSFELEDFLKAGKVQKQESEPEQAKAQEPVGAEVFANRGNERIAALMPGSQDDGNEEAEADEVKMRISTLRMCIAAAAAVLALIFVLPSLNNYDNAPVKRCAIDFGALGNVVKTLDKKTASAAAQTKAKDSILGENLSAMAGKEGKEKPLQGVQCAKSSQKTPSDSRQKVDNGITEEGYCIVLASRITKKNANDYVLTLQKQGISKARVLQQDGKFRKVVCGNFRTKDEAQSRLRIMQKSQEFKDAWVLKAKN